MKKHPKDLGVKIGSPLEVMWTAVLKNAKIVLKTAEETQIIQKEIIKLAEKKIEDEWEKQKV
jgi:hypothetical protein